MDSGSTDQRDSIGARETESVVARSTKPIFVLLVLLATVASYWPAFDAGYVWDDFQYVVENQTLRSLDGLGRIWFEPRASPQYYPLVYTTFWIEYRLWQLEPTGYHATNIVLHAINALVLWSLLRRLALPGAWLAALLFALHPVHVESVAWVAERKNLLSGLFYLGSALAYLRYRGLEAERPRGRWGAYVSSLLLFAGALLSKSVTASLPAAILLVLYWKTGRVVARDVLRLTPFFGAGVAAGLHTAWLERVHVGASGPIWDFSFVDRLLIASRAVCHYATKLFWPNPLAFSYPRWTIDASAPGQYLFGIALLALLGWLVWHRNRRRGLLVAVLFFGGTLVPALGFIDLYPMRFSFVADHFQYLASLGVIVPFAVGFARVQDRWRAQATGWARGLGAAAVVLMMGALASLTFDQTKIYQDEETLWKDTLRKNPGSWMSHNNLGRVYALRGDYDEAIDHFRRTLEMVPDYYVAETNLAEALIYRSEHAAAIQHLRHALSLEPDYADAHFLLWTALNALGRTEEAMPHLQRESELLSGFAPHFRAARLLAQAGRPKEALAQLDHAERYRPESLSIAVDRGNLYVDLGDFENAASAYTEAVARDPRSPVAHHLLGRALEALGRFGPAERHYARAVKLDPDHARAKAGLARLLRQRLRGGADHERAADQEGSRP